MIEFTVVTGAANAIAISTTPSAILTNRRASSMDRRVADRAVGSAASRMRQGYGIGGIIIAGFGQGQIALVIQHLAAQGVVSGQFPQGDIVIASQASDSTADFSQLDSAIDAMGMQDTVVLGIQHIS